MSTGLSFGPLPRSTPGDLTADDFTRLLMQRAPGLLQGFGLGGPEQAPASPPSMPAFSLGPMPQSSVPQPTLVLPEQSVSPEPQPMTAPLPPTRPLSFGPLPGPAPNITPQADMPAADAVPAQGRGLPPLSFGPMPAPSNPAPMSSAPAPAPAPVAGDEGGGFLSSLSRPSVYNLLLGLGQGLLTTKGFGPGIAAGTAYASKLTKDQAATDLAQAEYGLKAGKIQREALANNVTFKSLVARGHAPETVQLAISAAQAGHGDALNNLLQTAVPKPQEVPFGWVKQPDGSFAPAAGGPQDVNTIRAQNNAREADKTQTPLMDPEARAAAGIAPNDRRPAWRDPDGKVTFNDGPKPQVQTMVGPGGEKVSRVYNSATGTFDAPDYGATPPRSSIDTSNVPPGVDPATYRRELAKGAAAEQKGASARALQARDALPILDRAEKAYQALGDAKAIGPYQASRLNRALGGAMGADVEVHRQEYEAAAKELELAKAQISMKGQGAITESERAILRMTLPRLDAASPETGLNTLRGMRDQFNRSISADRLPSRTGGTGISVPTTPAQPSREAMEAEARRRGLIR